MAPSRSSGRKEAMHRLFVAIRPPEQVRDLLIDAMDDSPALRWVGDEQLHLTLRFIGEVERPRANDIAAALQDLRSPPFRTARVRCRQIRTEEWRCPLGRRRAERAGCRAGRKGGARPSAGRAGAGAQGIFAAHHIGAMEPRKRGSRGGLPPAELEPAVRAVPGGSFHPLRKPSQSSRPALRRGRGLSSWLIRLASTGELFP